MKLKFLRSKPCYHGIQAKFQTLKSLVKTNGYYGFDFRNFSFITNYLFLQRDGEGTTYSSLSGHIGYTSLREHCLLPADHSGVIYAGAYLFPPFTTNQEIGYNNLRGYSLLPADHSGLIAMRGPISSPLFTTNQVQCRREHTSSPLSTTLSTCLLVTQNLASYSVKSLLPG